MDRQVYSLCFMCSVRCPIQVGVKDGHVDWIQGNPHVAGIDGRLCPRGSAGKSLLYDEQRLQSPLIRVGDRGRATGARPPGMRPWIMSGPGSRRSRRPMGVMPSP
jgi:anaerobic selenocysteine-containing dehydrogenase